MVTDDERRRVAERLRWLVAVGMPPWAGYTYDAVMGCMPIVGMDSAYNESLFRGYCLRLADLIDPDCDEGRYEGVHTARPVDRKKLLALEDEMDKWALTCDHYDRQVSPLDVTKYADRIREALGGGGRVSVVTLEGHAFPSVLNVRVDGKLRRYVPERCGREKLLELADECEGASRAYADDGHELTSKHFANVARRIHEAIGETS